jgi:RNA polymerase sigma-70 factor (ECF subfamily)
LNAFQDQRDVDRVLAGDVSAFEGLVERWQRPLVNLAYRFCRDKFRAEDLAQEAFLRAYRNLSQWRRQSAFSTWLFAVAVNVYRTELRRIPQGTIPLEDVPELRDRAAVATDDAQGRDEMIRRAVAGLPAKYREAVTLFYFHEMDVPAAAHSLGLPDGTLKARLSRAREMLRSRLAWKEITNARP